MGRDFQTFLEHIDRCQDRGNVHEQFDPCGDMDGAIDAFWICGFDEDGNLVHTQAAHLLDLRGSSVAEHIQATIQNYRPKSPPLQFDTIRATPGPRSRELKGMTVYHGEMWMQKNFRDRATASLLTNLGLLAVMREWDPDAVFGLMNWALSSEGFNMRIGYTLSERMTLAWNRSDNGEEHQVWMVFLERRDLEFLLNFPSVEFASALERNFG